MKLRHMLLNSGVELHELTSEELKKLQETLLEIYKDIAFVCEKNGLEVFFSGGSCLGAVRHNGFIPWDDDMDLNMFREDYNKFPEALLKEFSDKYIIAGPGTDNISRFICFRVEKKGTHIQTVWDKDETPTKIGIDVLPVESIPENKLFNLVHGLRIDFFYFLSVCTRMWQYSTLGVKMVLSNRVGKNRMRVRRLIGFLFSWRKWHQWSEKADKIASKRYDSDFVSIPTGRNHYFGEIQKRSTFYPFKKGTFEGIEVNLPNDTDTYLKSLYGDYMQIPPVEKREKHFVVKIDFGE